LTIATAAPLGLGPSVAAGPEVEKGAWVIIDAVMPADRLAVYQASRANQSLRCRHWVSWLALRPYQPRRQLGMQLDQRADHQYVGAGKAGTVSCVLEGQLVPASWPAAVPRPVEPPARLKKKLPPASSRAGRLCRLEAV
jgi:hypothetical protein